MHLITTGPRPKPTPSWTGITLAKGVSGMRPIGIVSTGTIGRVEGYDDRTNALRAARMLSRGIVRDAAAVIADEGRWYVQGVRAFDYIWNDWSEPLRFEAQFPAKVGDVLVSADTKFHKHLAGLEAIVDGARGLRVN